MDSIDVDGLRIAYHRAGRGPALLLPHGYVGDAAHGSRQPKHRGGRRDAVTGA